MAAYYNDNDAFVAQWLRNLVAAGHLPEGDVDERSIEEIDADDLRGYGQVHMFAGIGGWAYALRLAGWPDDRPVWTGSCPCQPLSVAGAGAGAADRRHLWPAFFRLISECRPPVVFGEQVASGLGREWLSGVRLDLESLGYACGAADMPAAGVGAPHIRQRLWWVAHAPGGKAHASVKGGLHAEPGCGGENGGMGDAESRKQRRLWERETGHRREDTHRGPGAWLGNADSAPGERLGPNGLQVESEQGPGRCGHANTWARDVFIECADGKARRIESGLHPLAHGVSARVGRLRGYGNAIVPQVAAAFIEAAMGAMP